MFINKKFYNWTPNSGTYSTSSNWDMNYIVPNKYTAKVSIVPSVSSSDVQVNGSFQLHDLVVSNSVQLSGNASSNLQFNNYSGEVPYISAGNARIACNISGNGNLDWNINNGSTINYVPPSSTLDNTLNTINAPTSASRLIISSTLTSTTNRYRINGGTLAITDYTRLGVPASPPAGGWIILDGGTLECSAAYNTTANRTFNVLSNGGTLRQLGNNSISLNQANIISGGREATLTFTSTHSGTAVNFTASQSGSFLSTIRLGNGATTDVCRLVLTSDNNLVVPNNVVVMNGQNGLLALRSMTNGTNVNVTHTIIGPIICRGANSQQGNFIQLGDGGFSSPFLRNNNFIINGAISGSDTGTNAHTMFQFTNGIHHSFSYYPPATQTTGRMEFNGPICNGTNGTFNASFGENGSSAYNYFRFNSNNTHSGGGSWSFGFAPGTQIGKDGIILVGSSCTNPFGTSNVGLTRSTGNQPPMRNGIIFDGNKTISNLIQMETSANTIDDHIFGQVNGQSTLTGNFIYNTGGSANAGKLITFATSGANDSLTIRGITKSLTCPLVNHKVGLGTLTISGASTLGNSLDAFVISNGTVIVNNNNALGNSLVCVSYPRTVVTSGVKVVMLDVPIDALVYNATGGSFGNGRLTGTVVTGRERVWDNLAIAELPVGTQVLIRRQGNSTGSSQTSAGITPVVNGVYQVAVSGSPITLDRRYSTTAFGDTVSITGGQIGAGTSFFNPAPWTTTVNSSGQFWALEDPLATTRNPVLGIPGGVNLTTTQGVSVYDRGTVNISGGLNANLTFVSGNGTLNVDGANPTTVGMTGNLSMIAGTTYVVDTLNSSVDRLNITGNLILDGTLNLPDTSLNIGTYTIMSYTGSLTNNGLVLGTNNTPRSISISAGSGLVNIIAT
jgi:hypothetical protein